MLAIDTSSPTGSVAIADDDRLMAEFTLNLDYTHSRRLMRDIDLLLRALGLTIHQLDGLALTLGPGSFTGLRVGVATVKGMAIAADKPVAAVLTLDALAQNLFGTAAEVWALIDARKGEVFAARYLAGSGGRLERQGEPLLLTPQGLAGRLRGPAIVLGSGVPLCKNIWREGPAQVMVAPQQLWQVRASVVAALGMERLRAGQTEDLAAFGPLYLRPSDAELKASEDV